jgi:MFS family permease
MKTFYALWLTQGLSAIGSSLTYFTIVIWISKDVYSEVQVDELTATLTLLSLAITLPGLIISPIAGIIVDRVSRKNVMLTADFLQGIFCFITFLILHSGIQSVWTILLTLSLISLTSIFHGIAFDASYILIVPEKNLAKANALMQTMWTLSGVIAPILAALLLTRLNASIVILFDSLTFLVSMFVLIFLKIPSPTNEQASKKDSFHIKNYFHELKIGGINLIRIPNLIWLILLGGMANMAFATDLLIPVLIRDNFQKSWLDMGWNYEYSYVFIETSGFIGATLAGLMMVLWGVLKKNHILGVLFPLVLAGLMLMAFGHSSSIIFAGVIYFFRMGLSTISNIHLTTIWQKSVPSHVQGRVFGLRRFINNIITPLGITLVGYMGTILNSSLVLTTLGLLLVISAVTQFFNRKLISNNIYSKNISG